MSLSLIQAGATDAGVENSGQSVRFDSTLPFRTSPRNTHASVELAGALYLVYLGIAQWRSKTSIVADARVALGTANSRKEEAVLRHSTARSGTSSVAFQLLRYAMPVTLYPSSGLPWLLRSTPLYLRTLCGTSHSPLLPLTYRPDNKCRSS